MNESTYNNQLESAKDSFIESLSKIKDKISEVLFQEIVNDNIETIEEFYKNMIDSIYIPSDYEAYYDKP